MLEMHAVHPEELPRLREMWGLAFGDEPAFVDHFWETYCGLEWVLVLAEEGQAMSMLCLLPMTFEAPGERPAKLAYVYGLCTHPEGRGRGYAHLLLNYADYYARSRRYDGICTVPAEESLHRFFASAGYREGFEMEQALYAREELPAGEGAAHPVEAAEYKKIREALLQEIPHAGLGLPLIEFQGEISRASGADLWKLELPGGTGCAAAERVGERVILRELLAPAGAALPAVAAVARRLPEERYEVRTLPGTGLPGGERVPFGMWKPLDGRAWAPLVAGGAWLGLAFD